MPMAGVADRAMRELCRDYGAAYVVGELASAKGIARRDRKSAALLEVCAKEHPMGSQLFGDDPKLMAAAACRAMDFLPDFIDINMGCPAPKVANNGGGAALMKRPVLAAEIVRAIVKAVPVPVTVKIRAGWDEQSLNAVEVARRCEDAGASVITVHGRSRKQMYAPPVNLEIIRAVKQSVSVPVVGNGDVDSPQAAARMLEQTGCDLIMVGRAAAGAPWIFSQINAYLKDGTLLPDPPVSERMLVLLRQVSRMAEYKGERIALREARKHAAWYMRGLKNAAAYRRQCGGLETMRQLEELCCRVCMEQERMREHDS